MTVEGALRLAIKLALDAGQRKRLVRALKSLRAAGLVLCRLYTQADELPSGRHPRTNILRYFVNVALIDARAENGPSEGPPEGPSTGSSSPCDSSPPYPLTRCASASSPLRVAFGDPRRRRDPN
jgi:hypothetical protein